MIRHLRLVFMDNEETLSRQLKLIFVKGPIQIFSQIHYMRFDF